MKPNKEYFKIAHESGLKDAARIALLGAELDEVDNPTERFRELLERISTLTQGWAKISMPRKVEGLIPEPRVIREEPDGVWSLALFTYEPTSQMNVAEEGKEPIWVPRYSASAMAKWYFKGNDGSIFSCKEYVSEKDFGSRSKVAPIHAHRSLQLIEQSVDAYASAGIAT